MRERCLFLVLALMAAGCLQAGPCVTGTLASYEALPPAGCTVGQYSAATFVFTVLGSGGGAVPVTDTQITVTPGSNTGRPSLNFASSGFNVAVNGSVQYLIAYTWDPSNPIQSMDDFMDPPSAVLGFAKVTTVGCLGAAWTAGPTCPTSNTASVNVFDNNGVTQFNNSVSFSPVFILGIRNTIDLQALGGSASFDSFGDENVLPEPGTWGFCAAGLALLAARLRRVGSRLRS
jgi:PEP-CTERM motif.